MPTWPDDRAHARWWLPDGELRARTVPRSASAALDQPVTSVMRFPTCVAAHTPLSSALELLMSAPARVLVVVDEQQRSLGVVTPAHVFRRVRAASRKSLPTLTVLDAATSGGAFLRERSTLAGAARRFATEEREFLVVVAAGGRVAGIVFASDILQVLFAARPEVAS